MTYTQTNILDLIEQGHQNAQEGLQRAVDHAERETPGWKETAYNRFKTWLRALPVGSRFKTEDFRHEVTDLPEPPSARAFGALPLRAAREGLIRKAGMAQVSLNVKAHRCFCAMWEKV